MQFLPVGQGDAILIQWKDDVVWLVDGGPFTFDLVPYLKRRGIWRIDTVWLSHPHADHMEGLFPVLEQLGVGALVVGRVLEPKMKVGDILHCGIWRDPNMFQFRLPTPFNRIQKS